MSYLYQRSNSSPSGFPKNPPMSAPQKAIPATLRERHMGMLASRWPHSAVLSPVQMAAYLWDPAKAELEYNKRKFSPVFERIWDTWLGGMDGVCCHF